MKVGDLVYDKDGLHENYAVMVVEEINKLGLAMCRYLYIPGQGESKVLRLLSDLVPASEHGYKRDRPGRPAIALSGSVMLTCRVSPEQRKKYHRLGGSGWLRRMIDEG